MLYSHLIVLKILILTKTKVIKHKFFNNFCSKQHAREIVTWTVIDFWRAGIICNIDNRIYDPNFLLLDLLPAEKRIALMNLFYTQFNE